MEDRLTMDRFNELVADYSGEPLGDQFSLTFGTQEKPKAEAFLNWALSVGKVEHATR